GRVYCLVFDDFTAGRELPDGDREIAIDDSSGRPRVRPSRSLVEQIPGLCGESEHGKQAILRQSLAELRHPVRRGRDLVDLLKQLIRDEAQELVTPSAHRLVRLLEESVEHLLDLTKVFAYPALHSWSAIGPVRYETELTMDTVA